MLRTARSPLGSEVIERVRLPETKYESVSLWRPETRQDTRIEPPSRTARTSVARGNGTLAARAIRTVTVRVRACFAPGAR